MIEIVKAPPYATVQDLGFRKGRAFGLPPAGAMDPLLARIVNAQVGNPAEAAVIEWALGPIAVRFDRATTLAALPLREIRVGSDAVPLPAAGLPVPAHETVTLLPRPDLLFGYLAASGGIDVPVVLGSRSTYLPGRFGGLAGRRLKSGDRLRLGPVRGGEGRVGAGPGAGPDPGFGLGAPVVLRVTRGPQWDRFDPAAQAAFREETFRVERASDRSGYRLSGPSIAPRTAASLPSEPACPGAVQVPDNGLPIVLMPDGPTVGGYPKLAVVVRTDLRLLAQCPPGRTVRFREISLEQARAAVLEQEAALDRLGRETLEDSDR